MKKLEIFITPLRDVHAQREDIGLFMESMRMMDPETKEHGGMQA